MSHYFLLIQFDREAISYGLIVGLVVVAAVIAGRAQIFAEAPDVVRHYGLIAIGQRVVVFPRAGAVVVRADRRRVHARDHPASRR